VEKEGGRLGSFKDYRVLMTFSKKKGTPCIPIWKRLSTNLGSEVKSRRRLALVRTGFADHGTERKERFLNIQALGKYELLVKQ